MRTWPAVVVGLLILNLTGAANAQTRVVTGQAGVLAEWDLTATVTEVSGGNWSGPLSMKHIGFCSSDGPEEKTGRLSLTLSEPAREVTATMTIEGDTCTFHAPFADGYDGVMHCPGRRDIPMMLMIR